MKVTAKLKIGNAVVEVAEAQSLKELFAGISRCSEIFADVRCGCCQSQDIKYEVRSVSNEKGQFSYYNLRCLKCGAQLDFGQNKDGKGLFAKREEHRDSRGWYKYAGGRDDQDQSRPEVPGEYDQRPADGEVPF